MTTDGSTARFKGAKADDSKHSSTQRRDVPSRDGRRAGQIASVIEDVGNAAYVAMVRAMQPLLRAAGYRLLLHSTVRTCRTKLTFCAFSASATSMARSSAHFASQTKHVGELTKTQVPVVVIGRLPDGCPVDNVRLDSLPAVAMAVGTWWTVGVAGSRSSTVQ